MNIERIKHQTLTVVYHVLDKIRELIASGHFKVHDKIPSEVELAKMFGIGRSSIREAIKIFNYLGILESIPAKGTFVCDQTNISSQALTWSIILGKRDIFELLEVRAALELWSTNYLMKRLQQDSRSVEGCIEKIEQAVRDMDRAVYNLSVEAYVNADFNFHSAIIEGAGNSLFLSIYETLKGFIHEAMTKSHAHGRDLEVSLKEHKSILKAIKTANILEAGAIMGTHFEWLKKNLRYLVY